MAEKYRGSGLPGKFKAWLLRLMWLLTICVAPMIAEEGFEKQVNKHVRMWLQVQASFMSEGLYIRSGQLQLPLSSVIEEFRAAKCKWAADTSVTQAECTLKLRDIIGNPCIGRQAGTGIHPLPPVGKSRPKAEERSRGPTPGGRKV